MAITVRTLETGEARPPANGRASLRDSKAKIVATLITEDDALWPQIGKFVPGCFNLKQVDSIEQLLGETDPGAAAVLIWDVRNDPEGIARLSMLQRHSPRFAVLVLAEAAAAADWQALVRQNQIIGIIGSPIAEGELVKLLNRAGDEVQARAALLGSPNTQPTRAEPPARIRWLAWVGAALVVCGAIVAYAFLRGSKAPATVAVQAPVQSVQPETPALLRDDRTDQIESLLESAGEAMLERRYVTPLDNNALYFYRRALTFDASNGEARQGLDRLAELLLGRAQSAVDQRQFDTALQALEIARSLKPDDARLHALDQRLGAVRTELGAAQIQAALSAQNFERASSLIEEAARARAISAAQAAQLRGSVKDGRAESEINRFEKLAQARLQQDRLLEPANDNAAYYLERARRAGAAPATLAAETRQLQQKLADAARVAMEQQRFADTEKLIAALRNEGGSAAVLSALQDALNLAYANPSRSRPEESPGEPATTANEAAGRAAAAGNPATVEIPLKLLRPLRPKYPNEAALRGTEGWVDLGFVVTADGKTQDVRVVEASPPGVFDAAAVASLRQARYQALSATDKTLTRSANLRIVFRLEK